MRDQQWLHLDGITASAKGFPCEGREGSPENTIRHQMAGKMQHLCIKVLHFP